MAPTSKEHAMGDARSILGRLEGTWKGICRTWFEPGALADESGIEGRFRSILDGRLLRHEYTSAMQGKPRTGEETLIFNRLGERFEVAWFDSFHMNYGILFSVGGASQGGFTVRGSYDVGQDSPPWGWKTVYELSDDQHLRITAFNVTPDGTEEKAVETEYTRVTG